MGPLPGAPRGHSVVPAQRMPVQRTPTGQPGAGRRRCFCPRTRAPCPRSYRRACRRQAAPRASKIAGFMRGVPVSIRTHRTRGVSRWLHNMPCARADCVAAQSTPGIEAVFLEVGPGSTARSCCRRAPADGSTEHPPRGMRAMWCGCAVAAEMPVAGGQWGRGAVAGAPGLLTNATETLLCSFGKRRRGAAACLSEPMFRRMRT